MEIKKTLLSLSCLFIITTAFSQAPFIGKVIHKISGDVENMNGTIEVFYGEQKIMGIKKVKDQKNYDAAELLVDFSKGIIYHINTLQKTYVADTMKRSADRSFPKAIPVTAKNTNILNYQCSAFSFVEGGKGLIDDMGFVFWYADSLYFPVYDEHFLTDETAFFTNGKNIGMGITLDMELGDKKNTLTLTPVSVEAMPIPDSIFEIPKDYVLETPNTEADSVMIMAVDSAVRVADTPKKPIKKTAPSSNKKKVPVQRTAIKPKE